ncbi:unnamed protein product [Closterium sp. Yama58-4]|nr:unnamed protein product [Closterium sp. Yama58-4]
MIANGVDTFYADPTAAVFVSDSTNTLAAQPAAYSNIDAKRASHIAVLRRGEGKLPELWDDMRVSNEFSSDVAAGELEDIILRAASSSAVPNVTLPWSLDAVVPAATTATTAGWTSGISYYTAQADAGTLPQDAPQNTALHNTAPQQFHQEWSNGGAWTNSGRGEYQLGNAAGWAPPDFQGISRQNASTASTIADTVINERTDDDFATGGDGMPQLWSQGAGGTAATAAAVGISSSRAARHDGGGGFSPSHLPAILRSLAAHQQAVEALAPLVAEPQRQAGEWDGRTGEAAASAAAEWRSSASMAAAAAAVPQAPGFLPAEGVFPPLPLTRPAPAALFQRSPRSAALAAAFPATSSSASSAHLAASVAASLAGERLALVAQEGFTGGGMSFELSQEQQQSQTLLKHGLAGGGRSFETSQEQQRPQALPGGGLAGGGIVSKTSAAEGTAEPAAAQSPQNPSAIDALASMILVAAAAAGGQGGGFAGPPQGGVGGGTSVGAGGGSSADGGGGGMDGGDATGGIWGAMGGGTGGGMGGGMVGGVGGEVDEWHNTDAVGKGEAGVGWHGYGDGASVEGFEDGEGVEGTRILGRVSGACLAARKRRERIASQMRTLQRLVPGSSRVDTVSVLSDTIRFLCSLIHQIQSLGAEPEGYSTTEAVEAAAAEVQKLIRDGVIASPRPPATQRGPHEDADAEADADGTKDGDGGERDGDMEKGSWSLLHKNA